MNTPKKKSPFLPLLIVIAILVIICKFNNPSSNSQLDNSSGNSSVNSSGDLSNNSSNSGTTVTPQVDRLPSVPQDLRNHLFLNVRDAGNSGTLTGDVLITVIFVEDEESKWTTAEIDALKSGHIAMTNTILSEASSKGVSLNIQMQYLQAKSNEKLTPNTHYNWANSALANAGLTSVQEAGRILEEKHKVKEAPVLLYSNTSGRAFAVPYSSGNYTEYAVFYNQSDDASYYRHELYHLFGAKDYYFPDSVEAIAQKYYPNSTMLTSTDAVTDNLTAYLIGWTDTISADALQFLKETSFLTDEYMKEAHSKETYTGYVENWRKDDYVYTGYLEMGIAEGWGKKIWDNGNSYEGYFEYGIFQKEGTFVWKDTNTVYQGAYLNGEIHGQGTCTWSNGTRYSGNWSHGTMDGYGTYTWSDGSSYTGQYKNGIRHGQGTHRWSNGTTYEGSFVEGKMQGYGTMRYAGGSVYQGEFYGDKLHGYGTMTYADGTSVTGYWEMDKYIGN